MLFRAADTVVFCFDGDKAGRKAAWRALEATLPKLRDGLQAKFLFLPDGEDPDSMVRKHGEEVFAEQIEAASPLSEFFFDHFTAEIDLGSLDGRAKFVEQAQPYLEKLPAGGFRDMMISQLESRSFHKLNRYVQSPVTPTRTTDERGKPIQTRTPLRVALAHLVQNPALVEQLENTDEFNEPGNTDVQGIEIFRELVDFCSKRPNITTAQLIRALARTSGPASSGETGCLAPSWRGRKTAPGVYRCDQSHPIELGGNTACPGLPISCCKGRVQGVTEASASA